MCKVYFQSCKIFSMKDLKVNYANIMEKVAKKNVSKEIGYTKVSERRPNTCS